MIAQCDDEKTLNQQGITETDTIAFFFVRWKFAPRRAFEGA